MNSAHFACVNKMLSKMEYSLIRFTAHFLRRVFHHLHILPHGYLTLLQLAGGFVSCEGRQGYRKERSGGTTICTPAKNFFLCESVQMKNGVSLYTGSYWFYSNCLPIAIGTG
jgi:hypothetical protein